MQKKVTVFAILIASMNAKATEPSCVSFLQNHAPTVVNGEELHPAPTVLQFPELAITLEKAGGDVSEEMVNEAISNKQ